MLSISPRKAGTADPAAPASAAPAAPKAAAAADPSENRAEPRHPASAVPAITGLRFKPHGAEAVLINISETGLLAECHERLKPGSAVTAVFEGTFTPSSIDGRVARTVVSAMGKDGRLRYHVGVQFTKRCPLDIPVPPAVEEPAAADVPAATASTDPEPLAVGQAQSPLAAASAADVAPAQTAQDAAQTQSALTETSAQTEATAASVLQWTSTIPTPGPVATDSAPKVNPAAKLGAVGMLHIKRGSAVTVDEDEIEIEIPLTETVTEVVVRNRW